MFLCFLLKIKFNKKFTLYNVLLNGYSKHIFSIIQKVIILQENISLHAVNISSSTHNILNHLNYKMRNFIEKF